VPPLFGSPAPVPGNTESQRSRCVEYTIRGVTRVTRIASARFRSGLVGRDSNDARVYQQTFIHTYAKVAFAKPYDRKTPITAAEIDLAADTPRVPTAIS
jgi:hypothetical protein